jgi:hypothetical protein
VFETHLFTSNIEIVLFAVSEADVDKEARRGEFPRMDLRDGLGDLISLGLGQRDAMLNLVQRHFEVRVQPYFSISDGRKTKQFDLKRER